MDLLIRGRCTACLMACIVSVAFLVLGCRSGDAADDSQLMQCAHELPPAPPNVPDPGPDMNGASVLYAYGPLRKHFGMSADLTLPRVEENRGLFYADWIILISHTTSKRQLQPFVQISLLRWARYGYRPEVAYTWAGPDGKLIYADSDIFLNELTPPHSFGIAVSGATLTMSVDGRDLCHAKTSDFFNFDRPLYYQTGSEVSNYGDQITGTVRDVRLKTDNDSRPHPYTFPCMVQYGALHWTQTTPGTFVASGMHRLNDTARRIGLTPNARCVEFPKRRRNGSSTDLPTTRGRGLTVQRKTR